MGNAIDRSTCRPAKNRTIPEIKITKDSRAMNSSAPSIPRIRNPIAKTMIANPKLSGRNRCARDRLRSLQRTKPAKTGTKNPCPSFVSPHHCLASDPSTGAYRISTKTDTDSAANHVTACDLFPDRWSAQVVPPNFGDALFRLLRVRARSSANGDKRPLLLVHRRRLKSGSAEHEILLEFI